MKRRVLTIALVLTLLFSVSLAGVGEGAVENELSYEDDEMELTDGDNETHELTVHYDTKTTHLIVVNETFDIYPGDTFTFEHNTTVDIMAFPAHGWTFDEWSGRTENIENVSESETTITMEDDYHIEPEFVKAETGNVTFEVNYNETEDPVEGAELFLYVEGELYGEESDYIAETDEDGMANVTDIPLGEQWNYFYRVYKTGYQGIDERYGPIEEDTTIDDIVLKEAEDTFNLTIEEPENEGILWVQNIGTERVDPETWPFEREYSNNTGVNVFMDFKENESAPYKMYQDGELVHDSFETAHHPAQLEVTENITLEPYFTELNRFATRIEGEGNITVEGMVEPYDDEFEELDPIEDELEDYIPQAIEYRLTAEPVEGHEFVEWYDEKEEETYSEDATLTQHFEEVTNITARFRQQTHDVNLTLRDADSDMLLVVGAQVELECNETGEIEYEIESGEDGIAYFENVTEGEYQYTITHKDYEEKTGNITVDEYIEKDIHLESLPTYRLEIDQQAPAFEDVGTIELTARDETKELDHDSITVDYTEGTEVQVEAIPPEDLAFSHWEEDHPENKSEEASFNLTMNEDKNLTVYYEEIAEEYELEIGIEGNGTVEVDDEEVDDGWTKNYTEDSQVTLTADPSEGWDFDEWNGTDEAGEEITIAMDEDKEITAHFVEDDVVEDYQLTFEVEDEEENPIEGATVEVNDMEEITDSDGEAVFDELTSGDYDYKVNAGDHEMKEGTVTVDDEDVTEEVILAELDEGQIEVNILEIDTDVEAGEEINIEYEVVNTGETTVKEEIEIVIYKEEDNGEENQMVLAGDNMVFEYSETYELGPDESEEGQTTAEIDEDGDYSLSVSGTTHENAVELPEPVEINVAEEDTVEDDDFMGTELIIGLAIVVVVIIAAAGLKMRSGGQEGDELDDLDEILDEEEEEESMEEPIENDEEFEEL